jgi:hypothetical protein
VTVKAPETANECQVLCHSEPPLRSQTRNDSTSFERPKATRSRDSFKGEPPSP